MRIYLLGFMGSGKSTTGKRLARKIGFEFVDLDQQIEQETRMKISRIFVQLGEEGFRNIEKEQLHLLARHDDVVIATGGGTPCYFDNMDFILSSGVSVYLRMSHISLAHRLENAFVQRPLLNDLKGKDLEDYIEKKLAEREPYYMKANCVIKGETVKTDQIISLVFGM